MFKIKDRIILGAISGIVGGKAVRIMNKINYNIGVGDIRYNLMAAELFLPKKDTKKSQANLLGGLVNNINSAFFGIILTYLLGVTGKDYKIIKGMGIGTLTWIMIDGLIGSQILKIKSRKPLAPTVRLLEHLFGGAFIAALITKLGDESLFPPKIINTLERTPLVI